MQPTHSTRGDGLILGVVLGVVGTLFAVGAGGLFGFKYFKQRAQKGWNLVPVVVAAVDLPENAEVTMEMISQRSIPEQFVTASVVRPDSASYVVNQRVLVPLLAGDPLLWSQFATKPQPEVLIVTRDLEVGETLGELDVKASVRRPSEVTASFVRAADRASVIGHKVLTPFRAGDPVLSTHFAPAR